MTKTDTRCQRPELLKGEPQYCSPEQIETCHGKQQAHPCVAGDEETILAKIKREMGFTPGPAVVLSRRPGLLRDFMAYSKRLQEGGPLSERERNLIALAAAASLNSPHCIRSYSKKALKAGAGEDEVVQAILIAGLVSHALPLHTAYDSADIFSESEAHP
jgi:AhpD family alkylhydroperoxidase